MITRAVLARLILNFKILKSCFLNYIMELYRIELITIYAMYEIIYIKKIIKKRKNGAEKNNKGRCVTSNANKHH